MFSPRVPVYHLLHLAHRRGTLSLPEIAHCPCRVCKVYFAFVLIRNYLKISVIFFGHLILANVRNLYVHCVEALIISHSQVIANNLPNLCTIQLVINFAKYFMNPSSYVCPILLCED